MPKILDMACPKCMSAEEIIVTFQSETMILPDGSTNNDKPGIDRSQEWTDTSSCRCGRCNFKGRVNDFRIDRVLEKFVFKLASESLDDDPEEIENDDLLTLVYEYREWIAMAKKLFLDGFRNKEDEDTEKMTPF